MINPVWLFWNNVNGVEPPYVTLCKWALLHTWHDYNLIFLNNNNIEDYLPGIKNKVNVIEVDVKGRLDRFTRKFRTNKLNEAVKCDVYRANILKKYGGVYCDITSLPVSDLNTIFDILAKGNNSFVISKRNTYQKKHYPVSFYGTCAGGTIINEYCDRIDAMLGSKTEFYYTELGSCLLTPIVNKNLAETTIFQENAIIPIPFECADELYLSESEPSAFITEDTLIVKLFNGPFKSERLKIFQSKNYITKTTY